MTKNKKKPLFKNPETESDTLQGARNYYRHTTTGDRGYLVVEDGQTRIRLDRPGEVVSKKLDSNWEPETEKRPLLRYHLWKLTFEADRELCKALGQHSVARGDWLDMSDQERISWGTRGPRGEVRRKLFDAIVKAMEGLVE